MSPNRAKYDAAREAHMRAKLLRTAIQDGQQEGWTSLALEAERNLEAVCQAMRDWGWDQQ